MTIKKKKKKALKKLAKDLEKGESFKCEETNTELYKGWKFVVLDIDLNKSREESESTNSSHGLIANESVVFSLKIISYLNSSSVQLDSLISLCIDGGFCG